MSETAFQSFTASTSPEDGPPRLEALRRIMAEAGVDAFLVPRADAHQGEYVPPSDERLAWLTGFTGSAGFAAVTANEAGVFVDGRYRVQVRSQVAPDFTPVDWPETKLGTWLKERLTSGQTVAYDPWLHTAKEMNALEKALGNDLKLVPGPNLVDAVWGDRPAPPDAPARRQPIERTGKSSVEKREEIASALRASGERAAVLTLADSVSWLLNIRGGDIPRNPVVLAFAIIHDDARVDLFAEPAKFDALGPDPAITIHPRDRFPDHLETLTGPVRVDQATAPIAVSKILRKAGIEVRWADDPCSLPKAIKTEVEIEGARQAHLRDAVAMVEFLSWFDERAPSGALTEVEAAKALEAERRATGMLQDISFDTISGSGPNGAVVHYRVTDATNRTISPGDLYLVDSGGQYLDGTTDVTRTVAVGAPSERARDAFTRVLQGMIAISTARFPTGVAGRDLDGLARAALWRAGLDYDHGTGHGVGSYLCVHEGPQRLSRTSEVPLQPGMILSNEPGYYAEGQFGIRIENLIVVQDAVPMGDRRKQLAFETLTFVPVDTRLVEARALAPWERDWLNAYHQAVWDKLRDLVSERSRRWLHQATKPV